MKTVGHAHFRLSSSTPIRHSRRILMDRPVNASSYELGKRNRINFSRPSITARPPRGEQGPATTAPPLHGGGAGGTRGGGRHEDGQGGGMMYGREGWNTGEEGKEGRWKRERDGHQGMDCIIRECTQQYPSRPARDWRRGRRVDRRRRARGGRPARPPPSAARGTKAACLAHSTDNDDVLKRMSGESSALQGRDKTRPPPGTPITRACLHRTRWTRHAALRPRRREGWAGGG